MLLKKINVRHRNEAPEFSFLFGLVTTVYVGTGAGPLLAFGTQPYRAVMYCMQVCPMPLKVSFLQGEERSEIMTQA